MKSCLRCGGMELKKYGKAKGKIRKRCAKCGYQQTRDIARGRSQRDKALALVLYLSGLSMNMTGKIIGVSTQTIMRWIRAWSEKLGELECMEGISDVRSIEIDEMWHYLQKKVKSYGSGKQYLIAAVNSSPSIAAIAHLKA